MKNLIEEKITNTFKANQEIKLVYFFGSKAEGTDGPMSDYDFAIYTDGISKLDMGRLQIRLIGELTSVLKTDQVDLAVLNLVDNPTLRYNIIKYGKILLEREPFRISFETKVSNEYFDYGLLLKKHNLTHAKL